LPSARLFAAEPGPRSVARSLSSFLPPFLPASRCVPYAG
jgi:hypothetical protein